MSWLLFLLLFALLVWMVGFRGREVKKEGSYSDPMDLAPVPNSTAEDFENQLRLPVPYTLKMLGNTTWKAEWAPAVKSQGLPKRVVGRSRTSPLNAVRRLREQLLESGVISK